MVIYILMVDMQQYLNYKKHFTSSIVATYIDNIQMIDNFKYIKNFKKEERVADIYLYGQIGDEMDANGNIKYGINGSGFAMEFNFLEANCDRINVHINSTGGNVIDGYAIFSVMRDCKKDVDVYIDGLAASIAGIIAQAGDCIYMKDYALFMMHNPSGGDDMELLQIFKQTLMTMISKRSGLSVEELSNMMDDTTWLNAEEAKGLNLIDIIIETDERESFEEEIGEIVNSGKIEQENLFCIYNSILNKNNINSMKKEKEEKSLLEKLSALINKAKKEDEVENVIPIDDAYDDDDDEDEEMMDSLRNEITNLKKERDEMMDKLNTLEEEKKEEKKNSIKNMLNSYVTSKVISESEVETYTNLAMVDMNAVKNLLDKTKVINIVGDPAKAKLTSKITNNISNGVSGRETWNYLDWSKRDPKGFEAMKNSNPAMFESLMEDYRNKK